MLRHKSLNITAEKNMVKSLLKESKRESPGERAFSLLGIPPEYTEKKHNIKQDRFDSTIYEELKEASEKFQHLEGRGTETFPALLQDLWATFYKAAPELEDQNNINDRHQINRPFVERILEDSMTQETRLSTMLDELSSGMAAAEAGEKLVGEINDREELRKAMQQAGEGKMKEAMQTLQGAARDIRRAVRGSVQAGQEKAEELQQTLAGWGLEPGDLKQVSIGERMKLAEKITGGRELKRIADLVGKMRNLARASQREKVKKERDEIYSITVGGELAHTLPVELATLRHPILKLDFYRRFTEKQLLQYELEHKEKLGKGPIVALVDISGSMSGGRLEWAIACAMALADTASRQKRHFHIAFFNTKVKKEISFSPKEKNVQKLLEIATIGAHGGTDYSPALDKAMEVISNIGEFKKADIVMITDGLCDLPKNSKNYFTLWKEKNNTKSYVLFVGGSDLGGLKEWNEKVWVIMDLENNQIEELFKEVY